MVQNLNYKAINEKGLDKYFSIEKKKGGLFKLNLSNLTKPIYIKLPFVLNERVAALAGLMPDGSLTRDLMRIFFSQKKDLTKITLFENIMVALFSRDINLFKKTNKKVKWVDAYVNSKTLAWFYYYSLGFSKSDEQMRVPKWIFVSPHSVKVAYLRQAFEMEGTILKKLTEIRFVSKDGLFAKDMQRLLLMVGIKSHLTFAPRYKQKSGQYRVSIYRKENFTKFKEIGIGFTRSNLKQRFHDLSLKYGLN